MCGRLNQSAPASVVAAAFGLAEVPELPARYNVAPSQPVAVVGAKADGTGRGLVLMRWRLVPRWAKSPDDGPRPINARAESVRERPTFRESFLRRRCLVPAAGFWEWAKGGC